MDGLMLDTEPLYKRAWQEAARECGYQLTDEFYLTLIGRPTEDCERDLVSAFGATFPLAEFQRSLATPLGPGVRDRSHSSQTWPGKPVGLSPQTICANGRRNIERPGLHGQELRRAALEGQFQVIVTRDQVENGKPAPDLYLEAARRLKVLPSECVALEDSDAGLIAATRAGMIGILVPDSKPPTREAEEAAYRVLESLNQARDLLEALISK